MTWQMYGIPNCDLVKKAQRWFAENRIDFDFHDFKIEPLAEKNVKEWIDQLSPEKILNKKSTAWRGLSEPEKAAAESARTLSKLILRYPNLIKRPLLQRGKELLTGFDAAVYEQIVSK